MSLWKYSSISVFNRHLCFLQERGWSCRVQCPEAHPRACCCFAGLWHRTGVAVREEVCFRKGTPQISLWSLVSHWRGRRVPEPTWTLLNLRRMGLPLLLPPDPTGRISLTLVWAPHSLGSFISCVGEQGPTLLLIRLPAQMWMLFGKNFIQQHV